MIGIYRFVSQEEFDEIQRLTKDVVNRSWSGAITDYDHDTVYLKKVGEGVEMLKFRLWGDSHHYYIYVKPRFYAFKVIKAKIKRLIERWRS